MTTEQYINRLCRNIKAERFAWDKYLTPQKYFGKELCVTPLHRLLWANRLHDTFSIFTRTDARIGIRLGIGRFDH